MEREIWVKGTSSWCVLEECVKDNYYARFHTHRYYWCREMHFISRRDIQFSSLNLKLWQCQWSVKCRSRVPGHGACLKSMSRTITMQLFILHAITAAEKSTLTWILDRLTVCDRWMNDQTDGWKVELLYRKLLTANCYKQVQLEKVPWEACIPPAAPFLPPWHWALRSKVTERKS